MTQSNTEALTICIARRLAMHYKENQQAAIVQTAARMQQQSDNELTKKACLDLIAASPSERQRIIGLAERMFLQKE